MATGFVVLNQCGYFTGLVRGFLRNSLKVIKVGLVILSQSKYDSG